MLHPDPRMRPESMAEVEAWGGPATRLAPPPPVRPDTRRGRKGLAIGGAALMLAGGVAAVALLGPFGMRPAGNSPRPDEAEPPLTEVPQRRRRSSAHSPNRGCRRPIRERRSRSRRPPGAAPAAAETAAPPADRPRTGIAAEAVRRGAKPRSGGAPAPGRDPARPEPSVRAPPPVEPTMERVAAYIRGYRGGDCFFLNPTTVSAQEAIVEAYGTAPKPFIDFDAAFKKALGFEAKIQLRQVEPGQCTVVDLLARQAQIRPANVPKLRLDSDRLRSGEELRGTVDLGEAQNVALLLVERDGTVHDLGRYLKRAGRQASFTVRLEVPPAGRGRPQLVLAVGSQQPVAALAAGGRPGGTAFLPNLAQEMGQAGAGFGLAARLIKVGD